MAIRIGCECGAADALHLEVPSAASGIGGYSSARN
jgi:hypothetical protein